MAQNVTIQGASYTDVPSIEIPKTNGGTASFVDISDTTAAAEDVEQGKIFYTANGTRSVGTKVPFNPLDLYPIGSIYQSFDPTSPAELFGGYWTRIKGQFLLAAADSADIGTEDNSLCYRVVGTQGGSERITLTANQSGQRALSITGGGHTHTITQKYLSAGKTGDGNAAYYHNSGDKSANLNPGISANTGGHTHTVNATNATESHGNMPPYIAVYIWRRETPPENI